MTPESAAAGAVCRREADLEPARARYLVARLEALMDWLWSFVTRLFRPDEQCPRVHVHDGLVAAIVGCLVGLWC